MSLRAFFRLGVSYLRNFVKLRKVVTRFPGTFQLPRVYIKPPSFRQSRFEKLLGNFRHPKSLVRLIHRTLSATFTKQRPVNLSRAYNAFAGSVHLRHQLDFQTNFPFAGINEAAKLRETSWFDRFLSSLKRYRNLPSLTSQVSCLSPKELVGVGCNSAVWAAEVIDEDGSSNMETEGVNSEVAVKVLYNFYASTDPDSPLAMEQPTIQSQAADKIEGSVDWFMLHRQLERECEMRPSSGHPNIVPLVGYFCDRAPAPSNGERTSSSEPKNSSISVVSNSDGTVASDRDPVVRGSGGWVGAEAFPEGFGGRPFTYYLLMPRFEATLDDLFRGVWLPPGLPTPKNGFERQEPSTPSGANSSNSSASFVTQTESSFVGSSVNSSTAFRFSPTTSGQTGATPNHQHQPLGFDEAVGILAQLFDAVAELETHGIAHRDIKPNNILLRRRLPSSSTRGASDSLKKARTSAASAARVQWLDDEEILASNTRFHVAITDFGCAIRFPRKPSPTAASDKFSFSLQRFFDQVFSLRTLDPDPGLLAHSGNFAFLAPEIAVCLSDSNTGKDQLLSSIYAKADLWAVATLAYPLFGMTNPFTDGTLDSATYNEEDLPPFAPQVPGVITWVVSQCLNRVPSLRPPADLVADVLHTWCLLRHTHRRALFRKPPFNTNLRPADNSDVPFSEGSHASPNLEGLIQNVQCTDSTGQEILNALLNSTDELSDAVVSRLQLFLDVCWAADWLTGPARPPNGLRVSFYRRVTLGRLAACLRTVHSSEPNCSVAAFRDVPVKANEFPISGNDRELTPPH
ncbi:Serine/threonine-protein kinase pink1, mitochondrial [Clonorchis sinensis]|uniref:non-specific serine/threonine protein kinase n=1 Tax=Clonorchis sinensis TaxID=79923 RepID=A0A8T1M1C4_CLOSI|nr:Serine/threonine-protein kinase pink1, mitochondrial [Clonorchis sinensis]